MKSCGRWPIIQKYKTQNQKGYSLVELVVVIALVLILAGITVVGMEKWAEWSRFQKQNDTAKNLFAAAQNQLTSYEKNGQLTEFLACICTYAVPVCVEELIAPDGSTYRTTKEVYSVILTPQDYHSYVTYRSMTVENQKHYDIRPEAVAVYNLIYDELYDSSVLNALICVEIVPQDACIFSVWYSDEAENFVYADSDGESDTVSLRDRQEESRKAHMAGYYGISDSLAAGE